MTPDYLRIAVQCAILATAAGTFAYLWLLDMGDDLDAMNAAHGDVIAFPADDVPSEHRLGL